MVPRGKQVKGNAQRPPFDEMYMPESQSIAYLVEMCALSNGIVCSMIVHLHKYHTDAVPGCI
jgi:hypothetical protein